MKKIPQFLLMAVAFLFTTVMMAQSAITGTIIDAELNSPLPGANVVEKGTTNGVSSDFDGKFKLETTTSVGQIVISFVGYSSVTLKFTGSANLGNIKLTPDNSLDEIVIIGSGVIDLAEDRKTPIAVSTIKANQIQEKTGTSDLPEILKSTPSVQSVQKGGFGEGQLFLRGFDQTNTAFLLNGQPINGVEDGKMYWSNWSGVLDVAQAVQIQRGLGSSKLAISSVGGTVNIVTKTIDRREGGFVQQMIANDNYTKTTASYSTGLSEKGWAFTALLGHWQGEGYADRTDGQGQTYFLSLGYKPNENNIFNLMITGAPQWHAASGYNTLETYLDKGRRYNFAFTGVNSPNNISEGYYPTGRNVYHKPVANLSWDLTINDQSSLSTVLYASAGRGTFASTISSGGVPTYARGSNNNHNWYGMVSNYNNQLNEYLSFNVGADVRLYNGIHFRSVNEFLSIDSIDDSSNYNGGSYTISKTFGGINPWNLLFNTNNDHAQRFHGYYDYEEKINYTGVFGQLEYSKDQLSAFFQGSASTQSHFRTEYGEAENEGEAEDSDKINNTGFNAKAGAAYNINENNIVFVNAGYYSRQPYHSDLFINDRSSNQLNPFVEGNQKITGFEAGYKLLGNRFSANLNVYHTTWADKVDYSSKDTDSDGLADEFTKTSPLKQVHMGVELEIFTRPIDGLNINGYVSVGDWTYNGNITTRTTDDTGAVIANGDTSYIDGVKVGEAAQFTAGVSADYEILPRLKIGANWNQYDNLYGAADFGSDEFKTDNNRGSIKLPSYDTVDTGVSYKWLLGKEDQNSLQFRVNINNVFDEVYIENSRDNIHVDSGDVAWKGVNVKNGVWFGYGRTWNFSLRYNF
ncbi:TonB-dependent receptor [Mariniflexile litorale]|uniref:TonB-dependent receptor n=1 Tax=Mariniflexile litorale TaxID=3045158 RepID=A0AAU7EK48_9FLAO|nr:TonB-dependent receptor [Mariniflexile sp. KMM 9835]MDQ8211089.1 TonB-dependent receptor [Mariniflexile sp. KMM 9835]